jgi:hypothetical protein
MSDGVAMRKLGCTGAYHYFSLPQRPPLLYHGGYPSPSDRNNAPLLSPVN